MTDAAEILSGEVLDVDGKPLGMDKNERKVRRGLIPKLLRVMGRVPFAEDAAAAYYCAIDSKTPVRTKAVLLGTLVYFIAPFDAMPDLIPGVGFLDDAAMLASALAMVGGAITDEHRERARALLDKAVEATLEKE